MPRCPSLETMAMCKGWFQITLSEVGSVRRVCSISHIATMCQQRYRSSEMNEAQTYLKLNWLAISMRHCRQWFFLCPTLPLPPILFFLFFVFFFFFPSSGAPKRAPLQGRRKGFFFWGCGEGVMENVKRSSSLNKRYFG